MITKVCTDKNLVGVQLRTGESTTSSLCQCYARLAKYAMKTTTYITMYSAQVNSRYATHPS